MTDKPYEECSNELIATGRVAYPDAGLTAINISPDFAAIRGLSIEHGAIVQSISPNGPAASAGINPGDIVLAIAGQIIDARDPFVEVLFRHKPGDRVEFTIQRGSQQFTAPVLLEERKSTR